MIQQKVRVGLLGVGLDTYWGQFEGLLPRLLTYQDEIAVKIEAWTYKLSIRGWWIRL